MSIVETVLIFVVIPLVIYGLVALGALRTKFVSAPRYRPGQEWDYSPLWWSANPQGVAERDDTHRRSAGEAAGDTSSARGGASGSW